MINIELNNELYRVMPNETIIQSCYRIGEQIPRFCFHEKLSIAGNCRMCLIELAFPKSLKPVASCALPIIDNMKIFTNTSLVKKARESVLEFLLANHPLDCPICDQGGECDLQDETILFGNDRGRFYENKRSVEDKECGPTIKTIMSRCIHCTRCVRYFSEIVGSDYLGVMGRGSLMEIGTYIENYTDSELSGNVVDLCPVGALTSKPYSFKGRPWELRSVQSVDILDSMCSSIRIDIRGSEILRILPLMDTFANEEWISDKTRYFYDGIKRQRLFFPLFKWDGKFYKSSWERVFGIFKNFFKYFFFLNFYELSFFHRNNFFSTTIVAVLGSLLDSESVITIKDFFNILGSENFLSTTCNKNLDFRFNYIFNSNIFFGKNVDIFSMLDICLLIHFNPRFELPLLNVKLRRSFLEHKVLVLSLNTFSNLNYFFFHLSNNIKTWVDILNGQHFFCRKFVNSLNPLILTSYSFLHRSNKLTFFQLYSKNLLKYIPLIKKDWFGINIVSNKVTPVILSDLGLGNSRFSSLSLGLNKLNTLFYIFGFDDFNTLKSIKSNTIYIYQGHHGDEITGFSDLIFPSSTFLEKTSIFLNYEGFLKISKQVIPSFYNVREDWQVIVSFFLFLRQEYLKCPHTIVYRSLETSIHNIKKRLCDISPFFFNLKDPFKAFFYDSDLFLFSFRGIYFNNVFFSKNINFYMDDPLTRSSEILSLCSQRILFKDNFV